MNYTQKKSSLPAANSKSAISDNTQHRSDYSKKPHHTIISLTDAIATNCFSAQESQLLKFLSDGKKHLRKDIEKSCPLVFYTPSLVNQHLNPKLKTLCNMEVKSVLVGAGSQRKVWFLATLKVA
ncbi:MAG: hypothetical protein ACJAXS_001633 [Colwellia sp.]|jgi:hypothetical protein